MSNPVTKRVVIKVQDSKGKDIFQVWEGEKNWTAKEMRDRGSCLATGFSTKSKADKCLKDLKDNA